jgi:pyruvate formate lyase activating enzyme
MTMSDATLDQPKGVIFEIQRFSIHDGPGIRTTVFFKGCPLNCLWCHNPEGKSAQLQLSYLPQKCIACGNCVKVCPHGAHQIVDGNHLFDRSLCQLCGDCVKECWSEALEMVGRTVTVSDVLDEVLRDLPFYQNSGGGLTLSGGEPLAQLEFARALLQSARAAGLHTAIETCGYTRFSAFEQVMPFVDLFLFDIKDMDNQFHLKHTGKPNSLILANLKLLHDAGAHIQIRLPMIPGYNNRSDHFGGIADLVKSLPNLVGVEVMPYHRLGNSKNERFGLRQTMPDEVPAADQATVTDWLNRLAQLGVTTLNQV